MTVLKMSFTATRWWQGEELDTFEHGGDEEQELIMERKEDIVAVCIVLVVITIISNTEGDGVLIEMVKRVAQKMKMEKDW